MPVDDSLTAQYPPSCTVTTHHWVKCGMSFCRIGEGFYDDMWPVIGMFLLQY